MSKPLPPKDDRELLRTRFIGLGDQTLRKNYFPELTKRVDELARQEERFRRLFHGSRDIILVIEVDVVTMEPGQVIEVNDAACELLGYSRDELLRMRVSELVKTFGPEPEVGRTQLATKREAVFEREYLTRDGCLIPVEIRAQLFDLDGKTLELSVGRDITERRHWETELAESRALLRSIIDTIPVRVFWKDLNSRFLGCNPAFAADAGMDHPDQMIGKDDYHMVWADQAEGYRRADLEVMRSGTSQLFFEEPQTTLEGAIRWVRTSKIPLRNSANDIIGILGLYEDITERKKAEARILHLSSLYAALSQCNQAIVHCTSVEELFHEACRCVVENGFVKTAWVGLVEHETEAVKMAASYGDPDGRLSGIPASTSADSAYGCGPTGRALRTGNPQWCQDFTHDPSTLPWRDYGEIGGWASSAALPLYRGGKPIGCFTIYSDRLHAFDEETRTLLMEMAADISFALDNFDRESERQKAQDDLRASEARYHTVFQASLDAIAITRNDDGLFVEANRAFADILGYERHEIVGHRLFDGDFWVDPNECASLAHAIETGMACRNIEVKLRRKDGQQIYGLMSSARILVDGVACILSIFRDISELRTAEHEIMTLAFFDPLTGLPNRRLLMDRLQQALVSSQRNGHKHALLFVDLDNFKTLNDTLGHESGDSLLQEVAKRLETCVREADTVARLGGDEFVVILEDLDPHLDEAAAQAEVIGEKICSSLREPYMLSGRESVITASVGITLFGNGQQVSVGDILKQSDIAMYQAKAAGRNALRFFAPTLQAAINARAALEEELRRSIRKNQYVLHYQAQVALGQIIGAEVLVRWNHPQRGLIPPGEFIPMAEETGLILPLGNWVLETACRQIAAWSARPETRHLSVAVNVSARQFTQANFVADVLAILNETKADPTRLKLELTESMLVENVEDVIRKIAALKSHGVSFSLDDFGTGYSSLSYLKRLPLDQLKIDRSFVTDILVDPNDAAIARMIVALGKAMGLSVIAEGVENESQKDILAQMGCHAYQGYLFARPMPLEPFELYVAQFTAKAQNATPILANSPPR